MAEEKKERICTHSLEVEFSRFPPSTAKLAALGFEQATVSKSSIRLRKEWGGPPGKPQLFTEIHLAKNRATISYACPEGSDPELRRLSSTLILLRALLAAGEAKASIRETCLLLLPPLENAERVANEPYERLCHRCAELESENRQLSFRVPRIAAAAEACARREIGLERQNAALLARIAKLEALSDDALSELVLEWISAHRGRFSVTGFSRENRVPPARCEECLARLIAHGALVKAGGGFLPARRGGSIYFGKKTSAFEEAKEKVSKMLFPRNGTPEGAAGAGKK